MSRRIDLGRRRLVQGLAGATCLTALTGRVRAVPSRTELTGSDFELEIAEQPLSVTGAVRRATLVNGQLPAPLLRWREGDVVTLRIRNRLTVPTSIHWHGLLVPASMDGVPGVSFAGIAPGTTFTYR